MAGVIEAYVVGDRFLVKLVSGDFVHAAFDSFVRFAARPVLLVRAMASRACNQACRRATMCWPATTALSSIRP